MVEDILKHINAIIFISQFVCFLQTIGIVASVFFYNKCAQ